MTLLVLLPILIPFFTAIGLLLVRKRKSANRILNLAGALVLFLVAVQLLGLVWTSGVQVVQVGGWPAPFGITLVADLFSALMVMLASLLGLGVIIYGLSSSNREQLDYFGYSAVSHPVVLGPERALDDVR